MIISVEVMMAISIAILVIERAWTFIRSATNGKKGHHCPDHDNFAQTITELKTDVKWIRRALATMNPNLVASMDPRD